MQRSTEDATKAIMDMLNDRGCFNGIEYDLIEEIRSEIQAFIDDTLVN